MEPFLASEALAAGALTFRELKRFHRQLFPGVWVDRCADLSMLGWSKAGWMWSRRTAVLAGMSASAALGAQWIDADTPVELIHTNRRPPSGIVVHTDRLLEGETQIANALPVTTAARTAFDLGRRLTLEVGVERVDALMNATDVKLVDIEALARRHPRANGLVQLRDTLALVDGGAESLYESRTRLLLVQAGFPRPETQIKVFDEQGFLVARIDMGWREYRVGVDFEGAHHWTEPRQFTKDVDRYARLPELGWKDIRLTSGIFHNNPQQFLRRVSDGLIARGCPRTWSTVVQPTASARRVWS
ncbi:MAG: hypothetical protein ABWY45_13100 [Mycobacterium sp.]